MANQKKLKLTGFKFQPFSKKQMKVLTYWQDNSPVSDKFLLVADGSVRSGKEQPLDVNIFTPDGIKKMGELHVGDFVLGRDGNPTKILGVFPQGLKDVYRITFHDGSSTECGRNHLWSYTTKKCTTNGNYTMYTSTLLDIMQDLDRLKSKEHMFERAGRYRFPLASNVNFSERNVTIDPYLLGLLLGDGCFSSHNSGITFINDEQELHDYIEKILPQYGMQYYFTPRKHTHCAYGRLGNMAHKRGHKTKLRALLEDYCLFGCMSHTKFIPDDYKYNSERIRLALLAGILNTDGSVHVKNRPGIMFCSVSKQLRDDVVFLARSLGMWCSTERKDDVREGKHTCYSCSIRVNNDLYLLLSSKHKQRLNLNTAKSKDFRIIKSIEYVGKKECQCIYVDNSEHLYLTDDFIVTHNTICCSLSFVLFVMSTFNGMNAALVGRSSGALRRNVVNTLKQMLLGMGYDCVDHRADNYLEITKNGVTNLFWLFGAKDESSADLIQGITLCALYIDEVALIPQSFFNQATARLSVDGSKCMVCCNPASPHHWFYQEVLKHLKEKNGMYVHFTMDDNLTLSDEVKNRYKTMYSGVFKKRFIDGRWVIADGLIYDMFSDKENIINPNEVPYDKIVKWCIGVDYGTGNATVFLLGGKDIDGNIYIVKEYYFAGREEARRENDYDAQKTDLEFAEDMRAFIEENKYLTGKGYREIEIMIDPAAASFKLQLRRFHMKAKNADNSVIDGIRVMATFIGARRLLVSSECANFRKEVHTYSWDPKAQVRGEDRPLKTEDHVMDSARYLCMRLKDKHKVENISRNVGW